MSIEVKVPALGESVNEATVTEWLKKPGETVAMDDELLLLETDKVSLEVYAPASGVLSEIRAKAGTTVAVGAILGIIEEKGAPKGAQAARGLVNEQTKAAPVAKPAPSPPKKTEAAPLAPAVRHLLDEHGLNAAAIPASGKDGRLTKGDVLAYLESRKGAAAPAKPAIPARPAAPPAPTPASLERGAQDKTAAREGVREERVRMSRLRQKIAERLKAAQNTAAILSTFNEIDMSALNTLRSLHKDAFEKKHGVKLGFMSFFTKAALIALKELPAVNAEIVGDEIVYKNYYNIGIAVGSPQGLVVPVLKDADRLSLAGIESAIADFGARAREGKLKLDELSGGTFTISNGGVYGSLLSTPILNPPQSGILGMHKIEPRPVAVDGKVEIRPMMYVALSYDHRIIDGREAVTFLVRIKECLENPERMLLDS